MVSGKCSWAVFIALTQLTVQLATLFSSSIRLTRTVKQLVVQDFSIIQRARLAIHAPMEQAIVWVVRQLTQEFLTELQKDAFLKVDTIRPLCKKLVVFPMRSLLHTGMRQHLMQRVLTITIFSDETSPKKKYFSGLLIFVYF